LAKSFDASSCAAGAHRTEDLQACFLERIHDAGGGERRLGPHKRSGKSVLFFAKRNQFIKKKKETHFPDHFRLPCRRCQELQTPFCTFGLCASFQAIACLASPGTDDKELHPGFPINA